MSFLNGTVAGWQGGQPGVCPNVVSDDTQLEDVDERLSVVETAVSTINLTAAYRTSATGSVLAGLVIPFDTAQQLDAGFSGYVPGTGVFTAPANGVYQYSVLVYNDTAANGEYFIELNGSPVVEQNLNFNAGGATTLTLFLSAGDTLRTTAGTLPVFLGSGDLASKLGIVRLK